MPELPRVLLCCFDVLPGPTGTAWRISETLRAAAAHFPTVALTVKTSELTHIQTLHGARLLRVPLAEGDLETRLQTFARAVRRQLASEEYALVHFTDPFAGQVLCEQGAERGYKLVFDVTHFPSVEGNEAGTDVADPARFRARVRRQELSCLMSADAVVTGSPLTRAHLESVGVPAQSIHVLRTPTALGASPAPLPTAGEGLRLAYVGSAAPWQGLEVLLEAVARARTELRLHLRIVGPEHPVHSAHLRARAQALGLTPETLRIEGPVRREQLGAILAEADLGVLPLDRSERNVRTGAALAKIGDYLAAGRGVIAGDVPAARALLGEEVAAFFAAGDAPALADCIVRLGRAPEERLRLGLAARRFAEERLGSMTFARRTRELYEAVLGNASLAIDGEEVSGDYTQVHDDFAPTQARPRLRRAFEDPGTQPHAALPGSPPSRTRTDPAVMPLLPEVPEPEHASTAEPEIADLPVEAIDPWRALVVHGYCPPPAGAFSRPPPPTTFPGRDPRGPRPPSLPSMPAVRSKS